MFCLSKVRTSLKEAVEMSERQLQLGEEKDKEFVKLKLDIQQTVNNKDKTIKDQKKELKGSLMSFLLLHSKVLIRLPEF